MKKQFGFRAFSNSAPRLWNALPWHWESLGLFFVCSQETQNSLVFKSAIAPSPIPFSCSLSVFPLFVIWQRDCPSMRHEQGFSMDVWALYKLTIIIIINYIQHFTLSPLQQTAGRGVDSAGAEADCLGGNQNWDQSRMVGDKNNPLSQEMEKDHLALDVVGSPGHYMEEDQS